MTQGKLTISRKQIIRAADRNGQFIPRSTPAYDDCNALTCIGLMELSDTLAGAYVLTNAGLKSAEALESLEAAP